MNEDIVRSIFYKIYNGIIDPYFEFDNDIICNIMNGKQTWSVFFRNYNPPAPIGRPHYSGYLELDSGALGIWVVFENPMFFELSDPDFFCKITDYFNNLKV